MATPSSVLKLSWYAMKSRFKLSRRSGSKLAASDFVGPYPDANSSQTARPLGLGLAYGVSS